MSAHLAADSAVDRRDEIEADLAIATHRSAVDACLHAVIEGGARAFRELLAATEGADPRLVAQRVHALALPVHDLDDPASDSEAIDLHTPELHARDYEWYFSPACAGELATSVASQGRSVLCLGTPTVAFALLDLPHVQRVTLVDRNPLALQRNGHAHAHARAEALEAHCEDLAAARPSAGAYDVAVFDAPWYPPALRHWLAVAAAAVRPGGRISFALLQRLHRPSAQADRASILACARELGPVTVERDRLRYATPRFEREAMATLGIGVPESWRRADLVEVEVQRPPSAQQLAPFVSEPAWRRWVVGTQVIHLDPEATEEPGEVLSSVDERADFRYGSISTRDPRRAEIGLWTSRSRVARVRRPALVAALLDRLAATGDHEALAAAPALQGMPAAERARLLDALRSIVGPLAPAATEKYAGHGPPT